MGIVQDSACGGCEQEEEISLQVIQHCEGYFELKRRVLGTEKLTLGEAKSANITRILAFIRGTDLLQVFYNFKKIVSL